MRSLQKKKYNFLVVSVLFIFGCSAKPVIEEKNEIQIRDPAADNDSTQQEKRSLSSSENSRNMNGADPSSSAVESETSRNFGLNLEKINYTPLNVKIRTGVFLEQSKLRSCVIYLQGLGDSIRNHLPYFSRLSSAGYRVIAFDYPGQGGSEGSMNDMRIQVELPSTATQEMRGRYNRIEKYYEIPEVANFVWNKYKTQSIDGVSCSQSKKIVIGWSTGGLAAYRMANEGQADAMVLIAPGIKPRWFVGESASHWLTLPFFQDVITERTLTSRTFTTEDNPHLDPVLPNNPLKAPQFGVNLLGVAKSSESWKISDKIPGIVFLSSIDDTFVDNDAAYEILKSNAAHFKLYRYTNVYHELDNEKPQVSESIYTKTIQFLDQINLN